MMIKHFSRNRLLHLVLMGTMAWAAMGNVAVGQAAFVDDFADLAHTATARDVVLVPQCPPVPLEPEIRVDKSGVALFPSIVKLQNGDLLCAFHEPQHAEDPEHGRNMVSYSTDGGQTWSEEILAVDIPNKDDRDPFLYQAPDGRIWLGESGYTAYSDDNGRSWSEPAEGGRYPITVLSNGDFLWRWNGTYPEGHRKATHPIRPTYIRGLRVMTGLTSDGRAQRFGEAFLYPELGDADEWDTVETDIAGRMVAIMRQQNTGDYYQMSISTDWGRSFKPSWTSPIWHSPNPSRPTIMKMDDGTLVVTYAERQNNRLMAIASFDHGETWETARKLPVLDGRGLGDHGYPDACQMGPHQLLVVYYARGSNIHGSLLDTRLFKDAYDGIRLADTGLPLADSCIAYWSFDEADGNVAHDPARYNYGKIYGATRLPGRLGRALQFDGQDDYVMVIDCDTVRVPRYYALQAWINTEDASRKQTILDKGGPYYLGLEGGKLVYRTGEITFQSEASINSGEWTHVAVSVWECGGYVWAFLYVNGEFDSAHRISGTLGATYEGAQQRSDTRLGSGPLYQEYRPAGDQSLDALVIGLRQDYSSDPFLGMIDEVQIHAEGLDAPQIQRYYEKAYQQFGVLISQALTRDPADKWGTFTAQFDRPAGTEIVFSVLDADNRMLLTDVKPGAELSSLSAAAIHLGARLRGKDGTQTPVLKSWGLR